MIQEFLGSEKKGKRDKNMGDNREWAWGVTYSEKVHGPFASREEALEDAAKYGYVSSKEGGFHHDGISVGICEWADEEDYLPTMDQVLERMSDEAFHGDFQFYGDAAFEVDNEGRARQDFDEVIRAWAAAHVVSACWKLIPEVDGAALAEKE